MKSDGPQGNGESAMGKLTGQVAVVTGVSKGIGAGIARALGAEGASVVVNYSSSREGADRVVQQIVANGGKAIAVQGDVSKQADITRLFDETKKVYGKLDILVNNAGVYEFAPLEGTTENLFHRGASFRQLRPGSKLKTPEALADTTHVTLARRVSASLQASILTKPKVMCTGLRS
jgi:3-oxoacyl-[acyl-carrier protein] reductase